MGISREQAVSFALLIFAIAIILTPFSLVEYVTCDEPEKGYAELILVKMGLVQDTQKCPGFSAVVLEFLGNLACLVIGTILGYVIFKKPEEPEEQRELTEDDLEAWILNWTDLFDDIMEAKLRCGPCCLYTDECPDHFD